MSHRPKRRAGSRAVTRVIAGITAPLLVLITAAEAHDFWPVPDAVQVAEGNALEVRGPTARSASTTGHSQASDSAAAVAVVRRFNELLSVGDSLAALALLTEDAIVLESGSTETRAEYRSHHLPADIEFARACAASARCGTPACVAMSRGSARRALRKANSAPDL
jgi:hypothetical protein